MKTMTKSPILLFFLLLALAFGLQGIFACDDDDDDDDTSADDDNDDDNDDDDDDDVADDDSDDDGTDDDVSDDDVTDDDVTDDDVTDDDVTDDDAADDDVVAGPDYPKNHAATWDCYLCHAAELMNCSTAEPHGHAHSAPADCVACHSASGTNYNGCTGEHGDDNCTLCHGRNMHGKKFANSAQCRVCHQ